MVVLCFVSVSNSIIAFSIQSSSLVSLSHISLSLSLHMRWRIPEASLQQAACAQEAVFSHGVAGEKPGLSQRLRGTPSVPTASSAGPITPSPPNLPPPSLHSLSLTSCQPSRAHYPGMHFPSSLLCSSDLDFFF